MKLTVIVPARDEEAQVVETVEHLILILQAHDISHEILVVNDHSMDQTAEVVQRLVSRHGNVRLVLNDLKPGFGSAVRTGLRQARGDVIAIVMADGSDDPNDLAVCYRKFQEGFDCVFGSRFIRGARIVGYPWNKLYLNRLANTFIRLLFRIRHNDITNAFKCYKREVIEGIQPLVSEHFNLTVEMPLKAIVRGYSYATVPISWTQRQHGLSKLKIEEMGSRYLFIVLSVFFEKRRAWGDDHRHTNPGQMQDDHSPNRDVVS